MHLRYPLLHHRGEPGQCCTNKIAPVRRRHLLLFLALSHSPSRLPRCAAGSSHGESRIIRRTYPEDWYTQMMPGAYRLWGEAAADAGYTALTATGSLDFGREGNGDLAELLAACRRHAVPHEVLGLEELRERFPVFDFPPGTVGVYSKEGGVLHATKACAMFQQLAVKHGASLMDRVKVIAIRRSAPLENDPTAPTGAETATKVSVETNTGVIVETSKGAFGCAKCVLACGAWTAPLVKAACGVDLPVQPLQVYVAYWNLAEEWRESFDGTKGGPVFINYDENDHVYGIPIMDYQGLVKMSSHNGWPCDPDNRPTGKPPVIDPMKNWVNKWFGGKFDEEPSMVEACMYSMTPDQDFILDTLPLKQNSTVAHGKPAAEATVTDAPGAPGATVTEAPCSGATVTEAAGIGATVTGGGEVVVAAGFSGHGFKFGPLIGSIIADLVQSGSSQRAPMGLFSARRFEGGKPGNVRASGPQVKHLGSLN